MAKVRVYELARELDLESKDLVDKLMASGMDVKNYMSTLDDEAVEKARSIVSGKVSEVIEEKRVKPTVIRRRKKIVKVEEQPPEGKAEEKEEEARTEEIPEIKEAELHAEAGKEPERAESVAAGGTAAAVQEEEVQREAKEHPEAGEEPAPQDKREEIKEDRETDVHDRKPVAEPSPEAPEKAKAKAKKPKKKTERPARIIRRAEEAPLDHLTAERAAKRAEGATEPTPAVQAEKGEPAVVKAPETAKEEKRPKKKGKGKTPEKKEEAPKAAFRRRKREIYERDDLYQGRVSKGKERWGAKRTKDAVKEKGKTEITVPKAIKRRIKIDESVTVSDLAKAMGVKATDLIKRLMALGQMATINQIMDFETASLVADEFGYELELDSFKEETLIPEEEDRAEELVLRPPVVTIMGHVDHGKTSLLDYVRKSNIIEGESGGITQHIGAYYVKSDHGDLVFLDTPGHEAFTAMRARGAKVTDVIILVVAADDGVMPQTKEAVNHARAAGIPIVVAVNKIDKPEADLEKVKRELSELDLNPEEWGGDTIFAPISAKTGEGVDELLGLIVLQAEMLELRGNPNKPARGTVIEARLDKSKGPVATVLIKNGTLRQGDYFVCGEHYGRVRAMLDHRGRRMESAGPSVPVEIYGISGVPMAGDEFIVARDEKTVKQVGEYRKARSKKPDMVKRGLMSLDDLFDRIKQGDVKELNMIIKADVQGSLEALSDSLLKQSTDDVKLHIVHASTGGITESDVMLASASGAIVIGFNVRANPRVTEIAEREHVDIRYYDVIYNVVKDIRDAMVGLLEPVYEERVIGHVEVRQVFRVPKIGVVAGCYVTDGKVERNANLRLIRDNVVVSEDKLASLRRFKEDVKEVQAGYECGIGLRKYQDIKEGDVFEIYIFEESEPEL